MRNDTYSLDVYSNPESYSHNWLSIEANGYV